MDEVEISPGVMISRHHALVVEDPGLLVIADLHLGYEGALLEQGVSIPRFQKNVMIERLKRLIDRYSPEAILVNGDLKHEFSKNLVQEWEEVNDVLDFARDKAELRLLRGNHDNFLNTILSRRGLRLGATLTVDRLTFAHGHAEVAWKDTLVIGHEHPSLNLRDRIGAKAKLPCFLVMPEIVVLPAFSPLALGTDVTTMSFISPPLGHVNPERGRVYAVDDDSGILDFGTLRSLKGRSG